MQLVMLLLGNAGKPRAALKMSGSAECDLMLDARRYRHHSRSGKQYLAITRLPVEGLGAVWLRAEAVGA
jgi:hypothetical protein